MSTSQSRDRNTPNRVHELSNRSIAFAAVALALVGGVLVTVLLLFYGSGDHQTQLDAIKTAGTIVVGTGGAAALWLTARRQRTTEIGLNQIERDLALKQDQAAEAEADARARRITELYGRAVDQLGSDKAAVRLGGLYALERVAQDNPDQRRTILDVICAYLRMRYQPSGSEPAIDAPLAEHALFDARTQEQQVRLTAQRILHRHLRPGDDPDNPTATFWPDARLDLSGATLIDFDMVDCRFDTTWFEGVTFIGEAMFDNSTFTGEGVDFTGAKFTGNASFSDVTFIGEARFHGTIFNGWSTTFNDVNFAGEADFYQAKFNGFTTFADATFADRATFTMAVFADQSVFESAKFAGRIEMYQTWVRLDKDRNRAWPAILTAVRKPSGPDGADEGDWGHMIVVQ